MHRLIQFCLADEKFTLDFATNGRLAMHKMKKSSYHLIISDLMMPGMDGISFIKKIRSKGDDTPIVVTSAYNQDKITNDATKAGANNILEKPFNKEQLSQLVHNILN
jgi:CheY-like chemotaxis protein